MSRIILYVLLLVASLTLLGFDIPYTIKVMVMGSCPSEIINGEQHIDFMDKTLIVPEKLVTTCFAHMSPDFGDYEPASVVLDANLPDFKPLKNVEKPKTYVSDDQIRMSIYGYMDPRHVDEDANSLERSLTVSLSRRNREGELIYSKSNRLVHGMEHYISDKTVPIYSGDIYIARTQDGDARFYLQCFDDKEKNHRLWDCESSGHQLSPGISYKYYYNFQHISDARKIDEQVRGIIRVK